MFTTKNFASPYILLLVTYMLLSCVYFARFVSERTVEVEKKLPNELSLKKTLGVPISTMFFHISMHQDSWVPVNRLWPKISTKRSSQNQLFYIGSSSIPTQYKHIAGCWLPSRSVVRILAMLVYLLRSL